MSARRLEARDDRSGVLPTQRSIRVLVVGGLTRLDPHYRDTPSTEIEIDSITGDGPSLETRAEAADAIVLVVGNVSHAAAAQVRSIARRRGTPLASATGASVSRVRAAIALAYIAVRDGEGLGLEPRLRLV